MLIISVQKAVETKIYLYKNNLVYNIIIYTGWYECIEYLNFAYFYLKFQILEGPFSTRRSCPGLQERVWWSKEKRKEKGNHFDWIHSVLRQSDPLNSSIDTGLTMLLVELVVQTKVSSTNHCVYLRITCCDWPTHYLYQFCLHFGEYSIVFNADSQTRSKSF